jgi:hypothetical protein
MDFLELLFIISISTLFISWSWFIILGFRANKFWGFSIIFLSPITPIMFASRFARKARRAIYYYTLTLVSFIFLNLYIQLATVDFYKKFLEKISQQTVELVNNQPTTPIENIPPEEYQSLKASTINAPTSKQPKTKPKSNNTPKKHGYKIVNINLIHHYINKKVMITTAIKKHNGRLNSTTASTVLIKKRLAKGSVTMPIKKSKIIKIEVYL